jgi:hypothetical protein
VSKAPNVFGKREKYETTENTEKYPVFSKIVRKNLSQIERMNKLNSLTSSKIEREKNLIQQLIM